MHKLAKLLFPNNPKWVRYRKLERLFFSIVLTLLACGAVGAIIYYLNLRAGK